MAAPLTRAAGAPKPAGLTAVVTGGDTGIGRAVSHAFGREGAGPGGRIINVSSVREKPAMPTNAPSRAAKAEPCGFLAAGAAAYATRSSPAIGGGLTKKSGSP